MTYIELKERATAPHNVKQVIKSKPMAIALIAAINSK